MNQLTKAEEVIMHALWKLNRAIVAKIIDNMPKPKPHYNTVSTLIKILIDKGFVNFEAIGRSHFYYPLITKDMYAKQYAKKMMKNYFKGGVTELISFFVKEKDITVTELEDIIKEIHKNKKK